MTHSFFTRGRSMRPLLLALLSATVAIAQIVTPIEDGGTGAGTAAGARTNLGLGTASSPTFANLTLTSNLTASGGQFVGSANTTSSGGLGIKMGLIGGAIANATDAFIGVHNTGGPGLAAGDLLYVTRTTSGGGFAHRFFVESGGTPTERFTIGLSGISTSGNMTVSGTGISTVAGNLTTGGLTANGPAGTDRMLRFFSSGSPRWSVYTDSAAEGGSNAGSNLIISRYTDAGAFLDAPLQITRSNGAVVISNNASVGGSLTAGGRLNATINAGGNGWISTLKNTGGNAVFEVVATSAGPSEKAFQLWQDGQGEARLYVNATAGMLGTQVMSATSVGGLQPKGTATNDNAATGYLGEFLNATVGSGGAYSLTSGTVYSVTSIGLTPGDWDLEGSAVFTQAGGTTATDYIVGITNSLSAWDGGETSYARTGFLTSAATTLTGTMPAVKRRVSTSSSITYYLLVRGTFTGGTLTVYGNINARRVR